MTRPEKWFLRLSSITGDSKSSQAWMIDAVSAEADAIDIPAIESLGGRTGVAHTHQLKDWWILEKAGIPQKE